MDKLLFLLLFIPSFLNVQNEEKEKPENIHTWKFYYNDSLIYDSQTSKHATGELIVFKNQIKNTDTLTLIYHSDIFCDIPLCLIKDEKGKNLLRSEYKNKIPMISIKNLGVVKTEFHYSGKCTENEKWDEKDTRSLLNITIN